MGLSKIREFIKNRRKKKRKRFLIICAVVLLIILGVLLFFLIRSIRRSINAAAVNSVMDNDWITVESGSKRNSRDGSVQDKVMQNLITEGSLGGFGIDISGTINKLSLDNRDRMCLQVVQLLDAYTYATDNPCTLYGLILLTNECNFFTSSRTYLRKGEFDIYDYRTLSLDEDSVNGINLSPGIGGGRYYKNGKYNHGAFGIVQIEGDVWVSGANTATGIAKVSKDNGHLTPLKNNEAIVNNVMATVGQQNYLNSYSSYTDYVEDLSNVSSEISCIVTYAVAGNKFLDVDYDKDGEIEEGKGRKLLGEDWSTYSDAVKDILASMYWADTWNGGSGVAENHFKGKEGEVYIALAKYLASNGANELYNKGWVHMGNGVNSALGTESKEKLRKNLTILAETVFADNRNKQNEIKNYIINGYVEGGFDVSYSSFIYTLMGVINAQKIANKLAKACGYEKEFNFYAESVSFGSVELILDIAIQYMKDAIGVLTYDQNRRTQEGFCDCSSLVAAALNSGGYSKLIVGGWPKCAADIAQYLVENGAQVVYDKETDGSLENSNIMQQTVSELRKGDIIFTYRTVSGDTRYRDIHHVGMWEGNGKRIEATGNTVGTAGQSGCEYFAVTAGAEKKWYVLGTGVHENNGLNTRTTLVLRLIDGMPGLDSGSASYKVGNNGQATVTTEDGTIQNVTDASQVTGNTRVISWNSSWEFADMSEVHGSDVTLYYSNSLTRNNIVVGINAGHGSVAAQRVETYCHPDKSRKCTGGSTGKAALKATGATYGTESLAGVAEATINLQIAQRVKTKLLAAGFDVLMVREGVDADLDNIARTVYCNNNASCHIAIHFDSSTNDKGAFYCSVENWNIPDENGNSTGVKYTDMYPVSQHWKEHNALGDALLVGCDKAGLKVSGDGKLGMDLTQTSYSTVPSIDFEFGDKGTNWDDAKIEQCANVIIYGLQEYYKDAIKNANSIKPGTGNDKGKPVEIYDR